MVDTQQTDLVPVVQAEPTIHFYINGMSSSIPVTQIREKFLTWNKQMLEATYKEAAKKQSLTTLLFGLKAGLATMTPVLRLMIDANRQDADTPDWIRALMLPVPPTPRHADMLDFLCSYLIESFLHIAASGDWTVNVAPVPVPDSTDVTWTLTDFKVKFHGDVGPA